MKEETQAWISHAEVGRKEMDLLYEDRFFATFLHRAYQTLVKLFLAYLTEKFEDLPTREFDLEDVVEDSQMGFADEERWLIDYLVEFQNRANGIREGVAMRREFDADEFERVYRSFGELYSHVVQETKRVGASGGGSGA
jgi:hypothetical protein